MRIEKYAPTHFEARVRGEDPRIRTANPRSPRHNNRCKFLVCQDVPDRQGYTYGPESHVQTTHPANPKKVDATVARHVPITCDLHIAVRHPAALTLLVDVAIGAVDASRSERYVVPDSDTSLPE